VRHLQFLCVCFCVRSAPLHHCTTLLTTQSFAPLPHPPNTHPHLHHTHPHHTHTHHTHPHRAPSQEQMTSYDNELVWAIRNSDLQSIKTLHQAGRSMSACNRFSESIVHMACRRAELDVVQFILTHGGDVNIVDDYGRTPLHGKHYYIRIHRCRCRPHTYIRCSTHTRTQIRRCRKQIHTYEFSYTQIHTLCPP
jgi:hypothetical protein